MKSDASLLLSDIAVDRASKVPMSVQIYRELRKAIVSGRIRSGTRIPSTRALAAELHVSRNTTACAYDQLVSEGYLQARVGSGTVVSHVLPEHLLNVAGNPTRPSYDQLSFRGRVLTKGGEGKAAYEPPKPLAAGMPDVTEFPFDLWARLLTKHWRSPLMRMVWSADPSGYAKLREAIAFYVRAARAVRCEPEQVFVVNGSSQGLDIAARLLADRGDTVVIEDPGYPGARWAFEAAGARVVPTNVDEHGACVPTSVSKPRLAFLTPSHQYPLGMTMSQTRRVEWLNWARENNAWIIEDDFHCEYRYGGRPLPSVQGMDESERVIYLSTFSKTLLPSLRLAFMVLPKSLLHSFRSARSIIDAFPPILEQAVLAEFIQEGHFAKHVRRMLTIYHERYITLEREVAANLAGTLELERCDSGLHVIGWLKNGMSETEAHAAAAERGVHVRALGQCCINPYARQGLILGFATTPVRAIENAVRQLAVALRQPRHGSRDPHLRADIPAAAAQTA